MKTGSRVKGQGAGGRGQGARPEESSGRGGGAVRIRRCRPEDAERIKAITIEGFEPVSIEAAIDRRWPGLLPVTWGERKWRAMQPDLAKRPEGCFVAEVDGEVVGYITTTLVLEHAVGRIPDLAVDANVRGLGIGRRLLERALAYFREQGLKVARIETLGHNEIGRHLYPSVGFVVMATQVHFAMALDETRDERRRTNDEGEQA
ncbi:MAG: GNAT family N-acetyltransferase [Chloroflexi bacterium]|nr:GNAT family N-acetyltransferase [Chloroflexota bacterium]